jgi:hypothetical protein
VIVMAAPVASVGVTLGCFIRNVLVYPAMHGSALDHRLPGAGLTDFVGSTVFALLGALWIASLIVFVRPAPRSPLTIVLTVLALLVFGFSAWKNWLMAYPVCNPF